MLERVNSDVTFIVSDFLTNCDGGGRKSLMIVSLPFGASSSLLCFIELAPFSPFSGSDNSNVAAAHSKTHGENAFWRPTYAKQSGFIGRMRFILSNNAVSIVESLLSVREGDSVPLLINGILSSSHPKEYITISLSVLKYGLYYRMERRGAKQPIY
jgi:hypothetical protein